MGQKQTKRSVNADLPQQDKITTKYMLQMLMNERLRQAGYRSELHVEPEYRSTLKKLIERAAEVEDRFSSDYSVAFDSDGLVDSPDNLICILDNILLSQPRWGAVFAIFAFVGLMYNKLIKKREMNRMYLLVDYVNQYMVNHDLNKWIDEQGGWTSIKNC